MNPTCFRSLCFFLLLVMPTATGLAQTKPEREPLPNLDKRIPTAVLDGEQSAAAGRLRQSLPAVQVKLDRVTGAPGLVSTKDGFLSGRNGVGRAVSAASAVAREQHGPTKAFLREHRALFGHGPEALEDARVTRESTGANNGLRTVVWAQEVDGVEVFDALFTSHTTKDGELVSVSSHFIPDAPGAATRGVGNRAAVMRNPNLSARAAAVIAARSTGDEVLEADVQIEADGAANHPAKKQKVRAPSFTGVVAARLIWLPLNRAQLRLCWEIVATSRSRGEMYRLLVDAQTGDVLLRRCLTEYLTDASYRVYTSDSPSPFSPGNANSTITNQPPLVARSLLTLSALDTNASPAGWIPDGGNETLGNNVDAHTDRNSDNLADLPRPQGVPARTFDFTLNLAQVPTNYSAAAVVQLFYWNNWIHDKLYALGFTELAGNFQSNNFGRGGLGGDAVQADAQDGSGVNNANMSTPADGSAPRMQMFVFNYPTPDRDGDLDADIVLHEYVHGLSNRRVGGGVGLSASQSRGMGEGWSDFYALALLSEPGDNVNGNYAMGGYATYQFLSTNYLNNYYFGIRRYPYTTDLTKNPLTFKDIDTAQAIAHTNSPLSPLFTPFSAANASEVHGQGEVWCATLWEARANFVNTYGGSNGNWMFLQLVTDGMNLSPANPNFLEARDAIMLADQVSHGGANSNLLWTAFAKRGMGFSAWSPASSTTSGVIEAYDLPNDLRVLPLTGFVARGPLGGPFTNTLSLTLSNGGPGALNWSLANTSSWLMVSPASGTLAGGAATTVSASIEPAAAFLPSGVYHTPLQFTNLTSGGGPTRQFTLLNGLPSYYTEGIDIFSTNDLAFTTFNFLPDGSPDYYAMCHENAVAYPTDPTGGTTLVLTDDSFSQVTLSGTNTISLFGQRTNRLFAGSNGYLTLDSGDTQYLAYYPNHFNRLRVSGLFKDLLPSATGTVSWRELADRVAVTWNAVAEYGNLSKTNSFQIEMFFDGRLRMTYLAMKSVSAIAGLSPGGGTPPYFEGTDLSEYAPCPSAPVVIVQPTNRTVGLNQPASFSVAAFGNAPLVYQWRKDGVPVSGATNATLNFAAAGLADAGGYSAQITNAFGAVTSSVAALVVAPFAWVIPVDGSAYAQNFDGMGASGTGTPFGWYSGAGTGAITGTNVTVGDGSSSTAGNYNLGTTAATDRALGSLAGSTGGQRDTEARFINLSGRPLLSFNLSYTGEQWRVGGNSSVNNDLVLHFSLDGVNFAALGGAFNFNTPFDAGSSSALDGNAPGNRVAAIGGTFTPAAALTNNQIFYLRWIDANNSSSDHAMGVDDFLITFALSNPPPPIVSFNGSPTNGLAPLTVNFTNFTTSATSYVWSFGDGNFSSAAYPANTYSIAGSYSVTLVANGPGGTSWLTRTSYIVVTNAPPPAPVADFVTDVTNGLAPLTVNFTNLSSGATNHAWDFGDGNISTSVNPANTYSNAGSYAVTLTAVGPGGTNALARTNYIVVTNPPPSAPVVDFIADITNGLAPLTVNFTNLTTGATNYSWDFGDGNFSATMDAANVYSNAGSYMVTLTAVGAGGTNALARTNYIVVTNAPPPAPVVDFIADVTNGLAPLTVNFTNLTTGGTNSSWDFGDGNFSATTDAANTYSNAGSFTVVLIALGEGGTNVLTRTNYIVVTNPPPSAPVVDFIADVTSGLAPLTVNFTNLTTGGTNYSWDFGDGNFSVATDAANTYSNAGSFTVVLIALGEGGTNVLTRTNYIVATNAPPPAPVVDFIADVTNGLAPLTVSFTNLTMGATNYSWDFGDGNFSATTDAANTYSNAGSYTVTLTAVGAGGTNALARTNYIVVTNAPPLPVADFVASETNGFAPLTVYFTNLSVAATAYAWDFGDGNSSAATHPANLYTNAGNYTITLLAAGAGGTNTLTRTNHVLVANPPLLMDLLLDGEGFKFSFETLPGRSYSVQFKDSLDETNWQTLVPPVIGDGFIHQFTNPPPGAMRFYRLQVP